MSSYAIACLANTIICLGRAFLHTGYHKTKTGKIPKRNLPRNKTTFFETDTI